MAHSFKEQNAGVIFVINDTLSVEIIGFIQAGLMPGTTINYFPFTFTHPIVIKLGNTVNKHKIDNFPNLISDEDLIGSIEIFLL